MGNRKWWENVDLVSQRRAKTTSWTIWMTSLGYPCHDDTYVRPTDVLIEGDIEVPDITEAGLEYSY